MIEGTLSEALTQRVPGWAYHVEPAGLVGEGGKGLPVWVCWGVWAPKLADQDGVLPEDAGTWLAPPLPSPSVRCYAASPALAVAALTRCLTGTLATGY